MYGSGKRTVAPKLTSVALNIKQATAGASQIQPQTTGKAKQGDHQKPETYKGLTRMQETTKIKG